MPWYTCVICHKMYTHKSNLKRHIRSAHEDIRHHCEWCPNVYKRRNGLTRHIKSAHPEKEVHSPAVCSTPKQLRSIRTQTDLCKLATTPIVCHTGTNTRPYFSKDKCVGTSTSSCSRATSPIEWGCHSKEDQLLEQATQSTAAYTTAQPDDWTLDLSSVEEYFTTHCAPSQSTQSELSSDPLQEDLLDGLVCNLDFVDLDMF